MFKKIGKWKQVFKVVKNLKKEADKAQTESLQRFGLFAEGRAKLHMSNQDLSWQPLKASTLKYKKGDKILIETSAYFQSITSWVNKNTVYAGVSRKAKNGKGEEIANIAAVHEFGSKSRNIPARPLWKPTLKESVNWHFKSNTPEKILIKNLKKYFQ